MSNIEIKDLSFGYSDSLIFDQTQINIDDSWRLGLVGRNGRGKSTLLKILQGEILTSCPVKSTKTFLYFPQPLVESSDITTLAALSSLSSFEEWQLERELSLLKVDLNVLERPFDFLSGGEQTKCLLALLFLDEANFPLIDEPTNHLDIESRQTVADYLKRKSGFIVVSHDRNFLNIVCDHTLAIERQQIILYQGNFSVYEEEKKLRDEYELERDRKLRKEISRLKETAREKEAWSRNIEATKARKNRGFDSEFKRDDRGNIGAKAAAMMKKSKNLEKRMEKEISDKEKLLKNFEKIDELAMDFQLSHHKILLQFENFSLGFDSKTLFQPVNFKLQSGQIIALTAANGRGKSSILKYLQGTFTGQSQGLAHLPQGLKISYVRQIYDNRGFLKDFSAENQLNYELFLTNLRKLGMERQVFLQKIENMSQGQQKKVEVARSLSEPANLYLWDEPLNYLDVFNHEQISRLLQAVKPTMLLVEHDERFISEVAAEKIRLEK